MKTAETVKEIEEIKEIDNLKKLEAALFISARFLNLQELVMLTDINPLMLKELIEKLILKYNREESAIEIIVKDNMWKMDVRQEYVSMINKLATGSAEFTKSEQETLAVIAYKQPVKQSVIINIRGNKSYEHIRHFIEIGLVVSKRVGHTLELRLSDDFFEYFHLQKKEEDGKIIAVEDKEIEDTTGDDEDEESEEEISLEKTSDKTQETKEVEEEKEISGEGDEGVIEDNFKIEKEGEENDGENE